MSQGITEPEALQVQWLEHGLLVHGTTVAHLGAALPRVHALAAGAVTGLVAGGLALDRGWWALGLLAVGIGLGSAVALARQAQVQSRTALAPARRLLVELGRDRLAWTSLAGDRWSMRHDHEVRLVDVVDAAPAESAQGATVRVRLRDGGWDVPLYGVPAADVQWLAERITEAASAARQTGHETGG